MSDLSRWCLAHYQALKDFAGPVATVIAAATAVFVTWRLGRKQRDIAERQAATACQQARLAEVRLQHDLFERRFAVFDAVRDLLLEVVHTSDVSDQSWQDFIRGTEKATFLFDKNVTDYIALMRNQAEQLRHVSALFANPALAVGSERTNFAQVRRDVSVWFSNQFNVVIDVFKPALALERHISTTLPKPTREESTGP